MSNNWIYVGANINDHQWSKVGKTTRGLQNRHVSSQNPGFFIYTAYNIIDGDVHEIESNLLVYLESQPGVKRIRHLSTGSKSECFSVHPEEVACGNDSNLLIVFYVQIMPDDFVMQLHRF